MTNSEAAVEQIRQLQEALSREPANSARRRELTDALQIEAGHYRKALDAEQAAERFDPKRKK